MQWNLMWWLDNRNTEYIKNSIILVGLTNESRTSWYDPNHERGRDDPEWNNYLHSQWLDGAGPNVDLNWHKLYKYYTALTQSPELGQLNYSSTVRMFDGVSARYEIPVIQYNLLSDLTVDVPTLYELDIRNTLMYSSKEQSLFKAGKHPNEEGHMLIANKIQEELDTIL